jgi:hypothetical protein
MEKDQPTRKARTFIVVSTVFETNRGKVTTVTGNDLVGDMGPCPGARFTNARDILPSWTEHRLATVKGFGAFDGVQT